MNALDADETAREDAAQQVLSAREAGMVDADQALRLMEALQITARNR